MSDTVGRYFIITLIRPSTGSKMTRLGYNTEPIPVATVCEDPKLFEQDHGPGWLIDHVEVIIEREYFQRMDLAQYEILKLLKVKK